MKTAKRKLTEEKEEQRKKTAKEKTAVVVPDDSFLEILLRLPARSVGRFRCVSKSWLSMTASSSFVRAHTQHNRAIRQSLLIEWPCSGARFYLAFVDIGFQGKINLCKLHVPVKCSIRASCDGLLCLWSNTIQKHSIFNPATGCSSVILPTNTWLHTCLLAFYFHHSTSKYRLLAAAGDESSMLVVGENTWKYISCRLPAFCDHSHTADVNGSLHWLAWKHKPQTSVFRFFTPDPDIIMTFDKEADVYGLLSLPPPPEKFRGSMLVNFNGELGLLVTTLNLSIYLWVMEGCWVKKYSVNLIGYGSFNMLLERHGFDWLFGAAVSMGDEELLIDISAFKTLHYLIRWNLRTGACGVRTLKTIYGRVVPTFPYMESLLDPTIPFFLS